MLPVTTDDDEGEAQKMTRTLLEPARPRGREDLALVRGGREGTYWQAPDGLIVRLAVAEGDGGTELVQRELFELACRDAAAQ